MNVCEIVSEIRKYYKLTIDETAFKCSMCPSEWEQIENGLVPSDAALSCIKKGLNMSEEEWDYYFNELKTK